MIMIRQITKTHLILPTFSSQFSLWQAKVIKRAKFNGTKVPKINFGRYRFLFWPFVFVAPRLRENWNAPYSSPKIEEKSSGIQHCLA